VKIPPPHTKRKNFCGRAQLFSSKSAFSLVRFVKVITLLMRINSHFSPPLPRGHSPGPRVARLFGLEGRCECKTRSLFCPALSQLLYIYGIPLNTPGVFSIAASLTRRSRLLCRAPCFFVTQSLSYYNMVKSFFSKMRGRHLISLSSPFRSFLRSRSKRRS